MKEKTTIYLDAEVKRQAVDLGLNLSKIAENALRLAVKQLSGTAEPSDTRTEILVKTIDWDAFRAWLQERYRPVTVSDRLNYAQNYYKCLLDGDLSELTKFSKDKTLHTVKALGALAKYLGIHKQWKQLKERYGIKTTAVSSDELLIKRLTRVTDPRDMFTWIKRVKKEKPKLTVFMDFIAITGLRFEEAINANNLVVKLAKEGKLQEYYNEKIETLEHYKFKDIFIRQTKKAFVSFVPKTLLDNLSRGKLLNADGVRSGVRWRKLRIRFSEVRELHGTILTKYLKEPEIDFLHGRIGTSTFMRNYFNPAWISDLKKRVNKATAEILREI